MSAIEFIRPLAAKENARSSIVRRKPTIMCQGRRVDHSPFGGCLPRSRYHPIPQPVGASSF